MNPGRALDALVEEKVMGLAKEDIFEHEHVSDEVGYVPISDMPKSQVPTYSTDIADAWEVVEKMRQSDTFKSFAIIESGSGWTAGIIDNEPGEGWRFTDCRATADTAPHAICLAALKAVGATGF